MKLADLTKFLEDVTNDMGFKTLADNRLGYWTVTKDGTSYVPMRCNGKMSIVLPTKETLAEDDDSSLIFCPLQEDALKGESYMFHTMVNQANRLLDARTRLTLLGLGQFIIDHAKKLPSGKRLKYVNANPKFNKDTLKLMRKLFKMSTRSQLNTHLIGIYPIGSETVIDGKAMARSASVSSSVLDRLMSNEKEVMKVGLTKDHRAAIIDLINTVLPGVNDKEYNAGSNNKLAPYLDSFLSAYVNINKQLDVLTKVFGIKQFYDELFPLPTYEWEESYKRLSTLARIIPPQNGNLGDDVIGRATHTVTAVDNGPMRAKPINETPQQPASSFGNNNQQQQQPQNRFGMNNNNQQQPQQPQQNNGAPVNMASPNRFGMNNNNQQQPQQNNGRFGMSNNQQQPQQQPQNSFGNNQPQQQSYGMQQNQNYGMQNNGNNGNGGVGRFGI